MTTRFSPFDDLTYDCREVRFQAVHVVGEDPSLAGIMVFLVDEHGQWKMLCSWDFGPFDGNTAPDEARAHCAKLLAQVLA